jgi:hypothetical protein
VRHLDLIQLKRFALEIDRLYVDGTAGSRSFDRRLSVDPPEL